MSNDLREQLVKAGVVSEKQAHQADKEQKRQSKGRQKPRKGERGKQADSGNTRRAEQAQQAKAERDRQLNRQREEAKERKAAKAQTRQMARAERLNDPKGDIPYHFQVANRIKHIYVTPEQQRALSAGKLSIAVIGETHYLLPPATAERLKGISSEVTVVSADPNGEDSGDAHADDQVPHDLMW